jgi:hypothetical protein
MDLAHAMVAGGLAGRMTGRRFSAGDAEVREAEQRVFARRAAAAVAASGVASGAIPARREYPERGRHAAPRPARA